MQSSAVINPPLMQGGKSSLVAGSPDLTSLLDGVMPGGMESDFYDRLNKICHGNVESKVLKIR